MKIEHFTCEKCGCDKLIAEFQHGYNLFRDPSEACPEQLELHCPECGSDLIIRYNEPSSMRNYVTIDTITGKRVNMIFTNVEGYVGNIVNDIEDNMYVFFSRVGNDHKEYLMNDNNRLRSENAVLKNEIEKLKKKASVKDYMKLSDLQNATRDENTKLKMEVVKLREMNERVCKDNERLKVELTADDSYRGKYENEVDINEKLNEQLKQYKIFYRNSEKGRAMLITENRQYETEIETLECDLNTVKNINEELKKDIDKLKKICDEKDEKLEKVIKAHDNTLNACNNYENTLKEELNKVTKELESYKKQFSRLENEKINAWAYAYETIETKDKLIKSLETRLDNVIKSRKEINDEYTAYVNNNEDQSYYSMWHNLADEYCKLEDKYNKVYIQYEKYKKYCEDIVDNIVATKKEDLGLDGPLSEPSGTGCCLNEDE